MDWFNRLVSDRCGASAAEYAVILAVIGAAIAASAFFLGGVVSESMNDAGSCISTNGGTCP